MDLKELREQISSCDKAIAEAFQRRLELIDEVARYKKEHKMPIYDPAREAEILGRYSGDTKALFTEIMRISRGRQSRALFPYNIALIGFMGTGKSTVAPLLAKALGRGYIDLDEEIERRHGRSIPQIFAEDGESYFRTLERELVEEVSQADYLVIACGGGTILREENRQALKRSSRLVLLTASPLTILERVKHQAHRPLLGGKPTIEAIASLLAQREQLYNEAADVRVSTDGLSPAEVSEEVVLALLQSM